MPQMILKLGMDRMIREVVLEGDAILRKQMPDAQFNNGDIIRVLVDLRDTMFETGAVGFAANQIGEMTNICIVRLEGDKVLELINPVILSRKGRYYSAEGCMSIPNYWAIIPRASEVMIGHLTRDKKRTMTKLGLPSATYAQHEIDHLNGILIRDYVENLYGKKGGLTMQMGALAK